MTQAHERFCVGIDLGGTNIQAGVLGPQRKVLSRCKVKTHGEDGTVAVIDRVAKVAQLAVDEAGLKLKDIGAIGIGAPGTVDMNRGVVMHAVNLRWNHVPLAEAIKRRLQRPTVVDNDVNMAAWGEFVAGAGQGQNDMLAVWVGTGIGGGLVLNGRLYYGHAFSAGEIGHTVIHADAALGRRTLENCASRTAVVNMLKQLIAANHPSRVAKLVGDDLEAIRSKVLARALTMGDKLTQELVFQAAEYVGIAIANSVTLLSLPCVVVGGGVTDSLGKPWIDHIRQAFVRTVFPQELTACKILPSQLGDDAGIVGAALLAHDRLWKTQK